MERTREATTARPMFFILEKKWPNESCEEERFFVTSTSPHPPRCYYSLVLSSPPGRSSATFFNTSATKSCHRFGCFLTEHQ